MRHSLIRRKTSRRRGVVLIEFCVAFFCILLPLCMALMQFGIILQSTLAMENLSREAGRYASVRSLNAADDTDIKTYITTSAAKLGIVIANPTTDITVTPAANITGKPATRVRYAPITVSIQYSLASKIFLPMAFTDTYHISFFRSVYTTRVVMIMQ